MANCPAMQDEPVAEGRPFRLGKQVHQDKLDLDRVSVSSEAEAARQPRDVSINRDPGCVEGVAENDICGFAANSGQADEVGESGGNLAAETLDDRRAAGTDVVRLVAVESGGLDELLKFFRTGFGKIAGGPVAREERWRNQVDPSIGTLR
jgi:hypothetical protein